jgi:hypothetical protein
MYFHREIIKIDQRVKIDIKIKPSKFDEQILFSKNGVN